MLTNAGQHYAYSCSSWSGRVCAVPVLSMGPVGGQSTGAVPALTVQWREQRTSRLAAG